MPTVVAFSTSPTVMVEVSFSSRAGTRLEFGLVESIPAVNEGFAPGLACGTGHQQRATGLRHRRRNPRHHPLSAEGLGPAARWLSDSNERQLRMCPGVGKWRFGGQAAFPRRRKRSRGGISHWAPASTFQKCSETDETSACVDVFEFTSKASMSIRKWLVLAAAMVSMAFVTAWSRDSQAYPWMIRHEYTGCALCHTDPSGGFLLTQYGRAQTQTLLSSLGRGPEGEEVDGRSKFAFGVDLPEWLNLGFAQRNLFLYNKPASGPSETRHVWMQSDARAAVNFGRFEVAGSLGFSHEGGQGAFVTSRPTDNLVSREFWIGYSLDEDRNNRLRVGRMYLPFGLRTIDHYLYVRNATQTDLDSQQQYGVSYFRQSESYRFEVMGIAGNYQMRPDDYRQRGYAGYVEFNAASRLGVGMSSLVTYQGLSRNPGIAGASLRGAHGPFVRWAPIQSLALMSEWDVLHEGPTAGGQPTVGLAGLVQADWEFVRGLHAVLTPELYLANASVGADSLGYRGWLTAAWYAYPHIDLRADLVQARDVYGSVIVDYTLVLGQVHVSL